MEEIVEQDNGRNFVAMISCTLLRSSTTHEDEWLRSEPEKNGAIL